MPHGLRELAAGAIARRLVHIPVGRFAEPDKVASAVLFLANDE